MSRANSANEISDRLHSAAIHLLRRLRVTDNESGLSAPRLSALSVIVFAGPVTITDLARAEQVRTPTISRLLKELELEGYVQRITDENDRRIVRVRATPAGETLLQRGRARRIEQLRAAIEQLPTDQVEILQAALPILEALATGKP